MIQAEISTEPYVGETLVSYNHFKFPDLPIGYGRKHGSMNNIVTGIDSDRLRDLRISQGLKLQDVCTRAGIGKGTLSNMENHPNYRISRNLLRRVADALGVEPSELVASFNDPLGDVIRAVNKVLTREELHDMPTEALLENLRQTQKLVEAIVGEIVKRNKELETKG